MLAYFKQAFRGDFVALYTINGVIYSCRLVISNLLFDVMNDNCFVNKVVEVSINIACDSSIDLYEEVSDKE